MRPVQGHAPRAKRLWTPLGFTAFAAAAVVMGAALWWSQEPDSAAEQAVPSQAAISPFWVERPRRPSTADGDASPADPAQVVATAPKHVPPAQVDLCGLGRMALARPVQPERDEEGPPSTRALLGALPAPLGAWAFETARQRLLAQLAAGSAAGRTLALLLAEPADGEGHSLQQWAQSVVQQALASGQTQAAVWAEPACAAMADPGSCRRALLQARVALEPDNAAHWAALADEDPGQQTAAWQAMQSARRWHVEQDALLKMTTAALPADLPAYLKTALMNDVARRLPAAPVAGEGLMYERCQPDRAAAAPAACDTVMRLMLENTDSAAVMHAGAALAETARWPVAEVAAWRERARSRSQQHESTQGESALRCPDSVN